MKLSVAGAAQALGCSKTSVLSWEHGKTRIPRYIGLACAAHAFGIKEWGA